MRDVPFRRPRSGLRAVVAMGAALGLTGVAVPAASAAGAGSQLQLAVDVNGSRFYAVPASGVATEVDFSVRAYDPTSSAVSTVHDVTVTFTLPTGQVTGSVTAPGCTTLGAVATCLIPQVTTDYNKQVVIPVFLTAATGTPDGTQFPVTITATSAEALPYNDSGYPATGTVANRPNLVGVPTGMQPLLEMPRLGTGTMKAISVANTGTLPAQGMTLVFYTDVSYLPMLSVPANCKTNQWKSIAVCYLPNVVQPGEVYQLGAMPSFQLAKEAMYTPPGMEVTDYGIEAQPGDDGAADIAGGWTGPFTPGTGPALTATRTAGTGTPTTTAGSVQQANFPTNYDTFVQGIRATDGLTTDLAAIGQVLRPTGAGLKVRVGVRNLGAATLTDRAGDGVAHVRFAVPNGAKVTAAPDECTPVVAPGVPGVPAGTPGYPLYDCFQRDALPAYGSNTWDFTLSRTSNVLQSVGSVTLVSPGGTSQFPTGWDGVAGNDTMTLSIDKGVKAPVKPAKPSLAGETTAGSVTLEESISRTESAGAGIR